MRIKKNSFNNNYIQDNITNTSSENKVIKRKMEEIIVKNE